MDIVLLVLIVSVFLGAFIFMGYYVFKFMRETIEEDTNEDFDDTLKSEN